MRAFLHAVLNVFNSFEEENTDLLAQHRATLLHLSHLTVYLSSTSMSLFPAINALYATYFGTSPPTRACVAVHQLPKGRRLMLEGWAQSPPREQGRVEKRTALHVQSLSYWASANIGPYSQAIAVSLFSFWHD